MTQLAYSIEDVCKITAVGRSKVYQSINSGRLKARKLDGRTVVLKVDLENFLNCLEAYQPARSQNA